MIRICTVYGNHQQAKLAMHKCTPGRQAVIRRSNNTIVISDKVTMHFMVVGRARDWDHLLGMHFDVLTIDDSVYMTRDAEISAVLGRIFPDLLK